jgi:hypothetical protein
MQFGKRTLDNLEDRRLSKPEGQGAYSIAPLSRWRWNVLDLINICNKGAVPTYLFCDIDMSWAEDLRRRLAEQGHRVTVTALVIKAIAIAQVKHPESRTAIMPWGRVATLNDIVASFTVERFIKNQPAVYFGAITEPHLKSLAEIARELRDSGEKEIKEVQQLDLEHRFAGFPWLLRRIILWFGLQHPALRLMCLGATFGISSLGKYAVKAMVPPCVCASTFGVGSVEKRAVVRGEEVVVRPIMSISLNFDHRLIDGAPAARFLTDVRSLLEGGLQEYIDMPAAKIEKMMQTVSAGV